MKGLHGSNPPLSTNESQVWRHSPGMTAKSARVAAMRPPPLAPEIAQMLSNAASPRFSLCGVEIRCRCPTN
jgi:hypothetical protein